MGLLDTITAKLPFKTSTPSQEYFFALNIGLTHVTASVWTIYGNKIDILGQKSLSYHDADELVTISHQALDQSLGPLELDPTKILFGVPGSWTLDDDLKEPYLKLLRKMVKEFDLQPMAYVTTTHALSHMVQKQDGVPPTAFLLGMGDFIEVSLVRGGKVSETKFVKRTDSLFEDIEKLMLQFKDLEVLPSKIMLYATSPDQQLGKLKDDLMSYPWMSKLPFLHFPKIDIMQEDVQILSVVLAGAVELNQSIDYKHLPANLPAHDFITHPTNSKLLEADAEDEMGFVAGDVKGPINRDQSTSAEMENVLQADDQRRSQYMAMPASPVAKILNQLMHGLVVITAPLQHLLQKLGGYGIAGKIIVVPVLLVVVVAAYLLLVKATVTVYVDPQILERDTEVISDPNAKEINEETKVIPGTVVQTSIQGTAKGAATGQKLIGNPAKGKVIIYNLTDQSLNLAQGTSLSSNGLKFTLDTSVQVASQSSSTGADRTTIIEPGKSTPVAVTAADIGPDSNLPAKTELTVGNSAKNQAIAEVDESLSGGTSQKITIVTSDDQKKLQAELLNQLRKEAEEKLVLEMEEGMRVIPEALSVISGQYDFSKRINDQATEFSLNATVEFKGTSYAEADLRSIVARLVSTNMPEGYQLNIADTETLVDVSKVEPDGRLIFKVRFRAKLLPKYDEQQLKEQIKSKSVSDVAQILSQLNHVIGSEVKLQPAMPEFLAHLPILTRNIIIQISPK